MEAQWLKCVSCTTRTHIDEFALKKDIRNKTCNRCRTKSKENYKASKCEHGKRKDRCAECGGSSICEHKRLRSQCTDCGGSAVCEHKLRRSQCKQCVDPQKVVIDLWLRHSKHCDKLRNQETNITHEFCAKIITESANKCCYCAVELQMLERTANLITIERIDNRIGHVIGNCRVACFHCNSANVGSSKN